MKLPLLAALLAAAIIHPLEAKTQRSYAVKAEFKRLNPCPANGNRRVPCANYHMDHVIPLCAGGPDAVNNMQWLTVEEHKAKTKSEARMCRR